MTTMSRRLAPLNLAAMIPALPEVILPNGKTVQLAPLTAESYKKFVQIQNEMRDAMEDGASTVDEGIFSSTVDDIFAAVLPGATPDDLASVGVRLEIKLSVIFAAAGAVDATLQRLEEVTPVPEGKAKAPPRSRRETKSVAPARGTPKRSRRTG